MNKKNNRKGFTIVELVIVIAVIAILATVLVPTFGDVIAKANEPKAVQAARNEYTEYMIDHAAEGEFDAVIVIDATHVYVIDEGNFVVDDNDNLKNFKSYADAIAATEIKPATGEAKAWPATAVEGEVTRILVCNCADKCNGSNATTTCPFCKVTTTADDGTATYPNQANCGGKAAG